MAKFDLKFLDLVDDSYIKVSVVDADSTIAIYGKHQGEIFEIWLDKSTAIKFAKTLRTEINKITAREEGCNG